MQHIERARNLSDALAIPGQHLDVTPILDSNIEQKKLLKLYKMMAVILLQLSTPKFPRIGSLVEAGNGFMVDGRPITQNMNNMIQLANMSKSVLPPEKRTQEVADEWYTALAGMHVAQLVFQHNNLVQSEDDCRSKYVARELFYSLAKHRRLSTFGFTEDNWSARSKFQQFTCPSPESSNSFRLWCDDLRPANILLNQDDDVIAAIDWEFTYAAPT